MYTSTPGYSSSASFAGRCSSSQVAVVVVVVVAVHTAHDSVLGGAVLSYSHDRSSPFAEIRIAEVFFWNWMAGTYAVQAELVDNIQKLKKSSHQTTPITGPSQVRA